MKRLWMAVGVLGLCTPLEAEPPDLRGATPVTTPGGRLQVCGSFPAGTENGLRLDGRAVEVVSARPHALLLRLPDDLAPGLHAITGDPATGFSPGDLLLVTALRVRVILEPPEVIRGASATLRLQAEGSTLSFPLRLRNESPTIAALEGGEEQGAVTAGGTANRLERSVRGRRRGTFRIGYTLDIPPNDCAGGEDAVPLVPGGPAVRPGRLLALLPLEPEGPTQARARVVAATHDLTVLELHRLVSLARTLVVFGVTGEMGPRLAVLKRDPRVEGVQPDFVHRTAGAEVSFPPAYGPELVGTTRLAADLDGRGVAVALIDTGVDVAHARLLGRVAQTIDVSGRGFTPDAHGTLLAGILVAAAEGAERPGGIAPASRLVAVKACHPVSPAAVRAECTSTSLSRGLDLVLEGGAQVLNLSVAGPRDELVARLVSEAVRRGKVVAAAVGQGPGGASGLARVQGVLGVTAVDASRLVYRPAARGDAVDVAAPGVEVVSTAPGGHRAVFSGTSAATAFASGVAALVLQKARGVEAGAVLERTARDLGAPGRDPEYGSGLIDACRAVSAATGQAECR